MNKTKKIASAVVATVMAGTMVASLAACTTGGGGGGGKVVFSEDTKYAVTLNMNVGYQGGGYTSISYKNISGSYKMSDGITYQNGNLKPAWHALSDAIQVSFKDVFTEKASGDQIKEARTNGIENYDVLTGSNSDFITYKDDFLNLNNYLDRMPNYKAFLENDVATHMAILADVETGAMYYTPYFDGQDAIERYDMANRNWSKAILDTDTSAWAGAIKWTDHLTSKRTYGGLSENAFNTVITSGTAATSYMGQTAEDNWTVKTTDPTDATNIKTVVVKVDYGAALTAVKNADSELGKAYQAAAGAAYEGTSGNIVEIQNAAIAANADITGAHLAKLLQEYIKVTYKYGASEAEATTQLYGANGTKVSDIFNSAYACWDADIMTAMWRCVVTAGKTVLGTQTPDNLIYAYSGRAATSNRSIDMVRFAGTLYGIRGTESKFQYTYLDEDGNVVDARSNEAFYDALAKFGDLSKEGLVFTQEDGTAALKDSKASFYEEDSVQVYMTHDYSQSQTIYGLTTETDLTKYNFGPILTPVAKWDTTGKGTSFNNPETDYEYMRFIESWRAVKTTGFGLAAHLASNETKLAAALKFVDYLYSNDGQILMCFGPLATEAGDESVSNGGFWYGQEASVALNTVAEPTYEGSTMYKVKDEYAGQYLVFQNKVYTTQSKYDGKVIPTLTNATYNFFMTGKVTQRTTSNDISDWKMAGNYSNFSEYVIGSCLPIGVKSQGFEAQMTAECGKLGVDIVGSAIGNETIKHVSVSIDKENYWYSVMPSSLPLTSAESTDVKNNCGTLTGTLFGTGSKAYANLALGLLKAGYNTNYAITTDLKVPANAAACLTLVNGEGCKLTTYVDYMNNAWNKLLVKFGYKVA